MVMFSNNSLMNAGKNPFLLFRCGKDQLVRRNNKLFFFFFSFSQNNKQIKTWCCIKLRNAKMISLISIVRHLHSLFNDELLLLPHFIYCCCCCLFNINRYKSVRWTVTILVFFFFRMLFFWIYGKTKNLD
jgi:hypothetical protein